MHYGAMILEKSDIPLDALGYHPVVTMLWNNSNAFLDGYGWKPLSGSDEDSKKLMKKLSTALFADEIQRLNQQQKS